MAVMLVLLRSTTVMEVMRRAGRASHGMRDVPLRILRFLGVGGDESSDNDLCIASRVDYALVETLYLM